MQAVDVLRSYVPPAPGQEVSLGGHRYLRQTTLPAPGELGGPCRPDYCSARCTHPELCREWRAEEASLCVICGHRLGYGIPVVEFDDDFVSTSAHVSCVEAARAGRS